ncbi:zinc finger protein 652-like isoform X9 [Aricia agestis]|uniref:zinc finger protein 652-like isoform X9 n=1 Tax=Aricia agestis TaxID=91739 RepID=UPI001C2037C0|nr:zinc finger protein 652-like isoform X9 [Aricia agestis]
MEPKTIEWRPGPAVCRCCLAEGCYKDISTEYFWMGKREVYAEMLSETLDLSIAYSTSGGPNSNSRLICEQCISKLRDATEFKRQVQECERTFIQWLDPGNSVADATATEVKLEQVKKEKNHNSDEDDDFNDQPDFGDDDGYDDLDDDVPLTKYASKTPKKEPVDLQDLLDNVKPTTKRKSTTTKDKSTAKKAKVSKEKATSSKPKPEKKKKEMDWLTVARRNAKVVLKYSTAYPFKLPSHSMVCVYCCEQYDDPKYYRQHMREEHRTFNVHTAFAHLNNTCSEYIKVDCTDLACRICSDTFDNLELLSAHLKHAHDKDVDPKVEVGMQMFRLGPERWVCALCDVKLPSLRELSRHTSCHYHKYTCETCGKSYINKENLQRHLLYGHTQFKICIKCKLSFPSCEERRQHVLQSPRCWPLSCSCCSERFVSRKLKLEHMAQVHGKAPKTYTCPECNATFDKWNTYRSHFVLSHTGDTYACSFCGLKFDKKRSLLEHRVTHTKEKLFSCQVCSKSFSRKKNLAQHSWIHREHKRFECTLCNKQFNQRVSWKTHMKSYHPELVNF